MLAAVQGTDRCRVPRMSLVLLPPCWAIPGAWATAYAPPTLFNLQPARGLCGFRPGSE